MMIQHKDGFRKKIPRISYKEGEETRKINAMQDLNMHTSYFHRSCRIQRTILISG